MRRAAVAEHLQVVGQRFDRQAVGLDAFGQQVVLLDAPPAGGDLHAAEQQVERHGLAVRRRVRIERPLAARVAVHEAPVGAVLALRPGAELALHLRGNLVDPPPEPFRGELERLVVVQPRHTVHRLRARHRCAPGGKLPPVAFGDRREDRLEDALLQIHQVVLAVDEGHLHVERHVLVQVARGVVFFGPVSVTDLEHPLQAGRDHRLLVELRRLRQKHLAFEVAHGEQAGAALGA